jgi:hypothetical protein
MKKIQLQYENSHSSTTNNSHTEGPKNRSTVSLLLTDWLLGEKQKNNAVNLKDPTIDGNQLCSL